MSAHNLVTEIASVLKKYNADLTYTNRDDGVHIQISGKTVARREYKHWVIEGVGIEIQPQENKSTTSINVSKYSYTEQQGDKLVSYGFDTFDEMKAMVLASRINGLVKE